MANFLAPRYGTCIDSPTARHSAIRLPKSPIPHEYFKHWKVSTSYLDPSDAKTLIHEPLPKMRGSRVPSSRVSSAGGVPGNTEAPVPRVTCTCTSCRLTIIPKVRMGYSRNLGTRNSTQKLKPVLRPDYIQAQASSPAPTLNRM